MRPLPQLLAFVVLLSGCSGAEPLACPDSVKVEQKLSGVAPGWTAAVDDTPHLLAGITFFDGPPEDKVSLVYDKATEAGGKFIATWTFNPKSSEKVWVACRYAGTSVVLQRTLPPKTSACTATYDNKQKVAGLPLLEKLVCK